MIMKAYLSSFSEFLMGLTCMSGNYGSGVVVHLVNL